MSKKVFTLLLLAVFVLAQFSMASAAPAPVLVSGSATASVDTWSTDVVPATATPAIDVNVSYVWKGVDFAVPSFVNIWARLKADPATDYTCVATSVALTSTNGNGSFSTANAVPNPVDLTLLPAAAADSSDIQFYATVDTMNCGGGAVSPGALAAGQDMVTFDLTPVIGYIAGPAGLTPLVPTAACNTFNLFGLVQDEHAYWGNPFDYSGVKSFGNYSTITSAPATEYTAAVGSDWMQTWQDVTIPSTATAASWWATPSDIAGNKAVANSYYVATVPTISSGEKGACKSFTDEASTYARYLADLKLIGGYADGSFGGSNVLTRAELATLIEGANGKTADTLPATAPAGCSFSDVAATDWFAGWVWQACKDGFIAGYADGSFGPNDTLTRAHVVQVLDNVVYSTVTPGGYFVNTYPSVLKNFWWDWNAVTLLRYPETLTGEFTDVASSDYFYDAAAAAYGAGIFDATDDAHTTFGPNDPITREDFSEILYRAIAVANPIP